MGKRGGKRKEGRYILLSESYIISSIFVLDIKKMDFKKY
jgi:hypothetical protein